MARAASVQFGRIDCPMCDPSTSWNKYRGIGSRRIETAAWTGARCVAAIAGLLFSLVDTPKHTTPPPEAGGGLHGSPAEDLARSETELNAKAGLGHDVLAVAQRDGVKAAVQ